MHMFGFCGFPCCHFHDQKFRILGERPKHRVHVTRAARQFNISNSDGYTEKSRELESPLEFPQKMVTTPAQTKCRYTTIQNRVCPPISTCMNATGRLFKDSMYRTKPLFGLKSIAAEFEQHGVGSWTECVNTCNIASKLLGKKQKSLECW